MKKLREKLSEQEVVAIDARKNFTDVLRRGSAPRERASSSSTAPKPNFVEDISSSRDEMLASGVKPHAQLIKTLPIPKASTLVSCWHLMRQMQDKSDLTQECEKLLYALQQKIVLDREWMHLVRMAAHLGGDNRRLARFWHIDKN